MEKNTENIHEGMENVSEQPVALDKASSSYSIPLPEKLVQELGIEKQEKLTLKVEDRLLVVDLSKGKHVMQSIPLTWFLLPSFIASLFFVLYFAIRGQAQIPLVGYLSIASMVDVLGVVTGLYSFIVFFVKGKKGKIETMSKDVHWRNFPTILLSFVMILVLALFLFFRVLGQVFFGASFDLFTATAIFFLFVAIVNYFMIYLSISITPAMLTNILILVIVGGVFSAMATNSEQEWWRYNFSFLGTPEATNSWKFNLTLIFSALLMIALTDYLFSILNGIYPRNKRLMVLRILLILTAICLGGVGLFPYNESVFYQEMHNRSAEYLVYLMIILIISLRWLLPNIDKEFLRISYLVGVVLILTSILFQSVHYLSLTAFELIAFMLAFSWILLLLKKLQTIAQEATRTYEVILQQK